MTRSSGRSRPRRASINTYIVFGGVFLDDPGKAACSNAAVVIDRQGRLAGRYVKVHPVLDRVGPDGQIVLEGGVRPGTEYNVLDLDFGRVGVQICYDIEYPEGWRRLAEKGAELVLYPTQSPQLTRPGMYAATHEYWVVSSTFRNNASFFEPGTGLVAAQITEPKQTLVHEIDLSYIILPWSSRLRNGEAFREAFGDRVGYRYSQSEDRGIFWSNDPGRPIGQMARSLGLLETTTEQQTRARDAQDAGLDHPDDRRGGVSAGRWGADSGTRDSDPPGWGLWRVFPGRERGRDVAAVDGQPHELGDRPSWASPASCFPRRSGRGA